MLSKKNVTAEAGSSDSQPRNNVMTDLVKGAVIIVCLAGAYKLVFAPQTPTVIAAPPAVVAAQPAAAVTAQPAPAVAPTTTPKAIPDQVRALGSLDEQQLSELIKQRAQAVKAQGPVKFSMTNTTAPAAPVATVTAAAPTTLAPAAQPTPATLPGPAAQAAPAAPASPAAQANGPIAKIGYHPDGTVMTAEEKRAQIRDTLKKIPDSFTIAWKAPVEKASIYVFTDPTCPYCQKLHHVIPQLNAAGISVHYLLYPRDMGRASGNTLTTTQENLNNVWCSLDQKAALDDAYAGFKVPPADCAALPADLKRINSPVAQQFFLGNVFNVQGTPTVFTTDGKDLPGFQSAEKLIADVLN